MADLKLGRRFDASGDVRATYAASQILEVVNSTTAYMVMLAVAWCQIVDGGAPDKEERSASIMDRYSDVFGVHS
jgi:hypothetical protein